MMLHLLPTLSHLDDSRLWEQIFLRANVNNNNNNNSNMPMC